MKIRNWLSSFPNSAEVAIKPVARCTENESHVDGITIDSKAELLQVISVKESFSYEFLKNNILKMCGLKPQKQFNFKPRLTKKTLTAET